MGQYSELKDSLGKARTFVVNLEYPEIKERYDLRVDGGNREKDTLYYYARQAYLEDLRKDIDEYNEQYSFDNQESNLERCQELIAKYGEFFNWLSYLTDELAGLGSTILIKDGKGNQPFKFYVNVPFKGCPYFLNWELIGQEKLGNHPWLCDDIGKQLIDVIINELIPTYQECGGTKGKVLIKEDLVCSNVSSQYYYCKPEIIESGLAVVDLDLNRDFFIDFMSKYAKALVYCYDNDTFDEDMFEPKSIVKDYVKTYYNQGMSKDLFLSYNYKGKLEMYFTEKYNPDKKPDLLKIKFHPSALFKIDIDDSYNELDSFDKCCVCGKLLKCPDPEKNFIAHTNCLNSMRRTS